MAANLKIKWGFAPFTICYIFVDQKQFLIMYFSETSEYIMVKGTKSAIERTDGDSSEDSAEEGKGALPQQSGILQDLIDQKNIENVFSNSHYMFLSVLFGVCRLSVQLKKPTGTQRRECVALL